MFRRLRMRPHRRINIQFDRTRQQMQRLRSAAIDRVTQHRPAGQRAMRPHLVRASCARVQFQPRKALGSAENLPFGHSMPAFRVVHHAPTFARAAAVERHVGHPGLSGGCPRHHRPIRLPCPALGKLALRGQQCGTPQRHDKAAARIRIQAMHQPWPILAARQQRKPIFHAATAARAGVNRKSRRLVQNDKALILEQHARQAARPRPTLSNQIGSWQVPPMRIHLQNPVNDPLFTFTRSMWDAAAARAPDIGRDHHVTVGDSKTDFAAAITEAEALISDVSVIRSQFPCNAPRLKLLFVTNAGLDRLAPFDWLPQGAVLMNNRGTHAVKAGEFAIMSVLMLANRVPQMVTHQRACEWHKLWGTVLGGRRLTIVGLGTLGGATASHATHFGMNVTGVRARPAPHPGCARVTGVNRLDEVLPGTEFLVLACPLTAATSNLMDRRRLKLLPRGAGVVNIGRGELLDQDALCDLLDSGHLSGAVLDVFMPEPIPAGHRLWKTRNLIISPHTAADDPDTYNPRSLDIFLDNLRAWRDGRPLPNLFDIARGY